MSLGGDTEKMREMTGLDITAEELRESEGSTPLDSEGLREALVRKKVREKKKVESTAAAMDAYKEYMRGQGKLSPLMEKQLDYIRNRGQFSTEDVKKIQEEAKKQRSDDFLETLLEESKKATEIKEKYDVLVDEMKALDAQYEAGEISMEELQTHADRIADKIDNMKAEDRQGAGVDLGVFFGE